MKPVRYVPVQTERLYERIVEQIEARIVSGALRAGDQMPAERELAEQFGVSRTAVREAVKILGKKGLVEIRPGRGTFVINATPNAVRQSLDMLMRLGRTDSPAELMEVREILEPEIARRAAQRITEGPLQAMQLAVELMDRSLHDTEAFVEADLDFHLALAEGTGNPIIPLLMDSIIDLLREQRKLTGSVTGGLERGQYHHKLILGAVRRHDADEARAAMERHLQQVREDSAVSPQSG